MMLDILERDIRPLRSGDAAFVGEFYRRLGRDRRQHQQHLTLLGIRARSRHRVHAGRYRGRSAVRTPIIGDMRPTGQYVALDLYQAGGVPILVNRLIDGGYMAGDTPTVTGQTLTQACADADETEGQTVVRNLDNAIKDSGGLVVLRAIWRPTARWSNSRIRPPR